MRKLKAKILVRVVGAILFTELILLGVSLEWRRRELRHRDGLSPESVTAGLVEYGLRIGGMIALVVAGSVGLVYLSLDEVFLKPLHRMTLSDLAMAAGNPLGATIPEHEIPDDELGDLMLSRNKMLHRLLDHFEQEVEERTAHLRAAWRNLEDINLRMVHLERCAMLTSFSRVLLRKVEPLGCILQNGCDPEALGAAVRDLMEALGEVRRISCQRYSPAPLHVHHDVIKPLLLELDPLANAKRIQIRAHPEENLPHIHAEESLLKHAVHNLLLNAMQAVERMHTTNGGRVDVQLFVKGDEVHIRVEDNGAGFSANKLNSLREQSNFLLSEDLPCGLGLSMVREILHIFQGFLFLENAASGGAMVTMVLPIHPAKRAGMNA